MFEKYVERKKREYGKKFRTLSRDASNKFCTSIVGGIDGPSGQIIDQEAFDKVNGASEVIDKNFMPHFASEMVEKFALVGTLATIGGSAIYSAVEQNPELLQFSIAAIPGILTMLFAGSNKRIIEKQDRKIKDSVEEYISNKHASSYLSGFEKLATEIGKKAFMDDPAEYLFGDTYKNIIYAEQSEYIDNHALKKFEDFGLVSFDALKDIIRDAGMDM